ncbi:methionyl-tRNA formyltransferase [Nitrobacteraceae bacterium AZCC 1564]
MTQQAKPDVVLLGDGPTALTALRSLAMHCRVVRVLRGLDQPETDPVRAFAAANDIPVSDLQGLDQLSKLIVDLRPAAVVISSFHRIIPPQILTSSRFINVHYSLLPQYRGRANVNWAVINNEDATGISIHLVVPGLDSGNLLFQQAVAIAPEDTVTSLYERLNAIQERELGRVVTNAIAGDQGIPQDAHQATYGCTRVPDDGEINWRQPTAAIDRLIRGLAPPFPGAFTYLNGERLMIARASAVFDPPAYVGRVPGRIVGRSAKEGWVDVLTGDGVLRIFSVGTSTCGDPCTPASVIRSTRITLGLSRLDLLRRITALEARIALLERSERVDE